MDVDVTPLPNFCKRLGGGKDRRGEKGKQGQDRGRDHLATRDMSSGIELGVLLLLEGSEEGSDAFIPEDIILDSLVSGHEPGLSVDPLVEPSFRFLSVFRGVWFVATIPVLEPVVHSC
ncbi:hypothetical protein JTB14_029886 [Gonioctena quinquepunctata]|nr:hypothetical protein JTB14_029886 [Gonioctena quinquepunctata]